jgi:N-terminal domain of molybdenum-binding protein
MVFGYGRVLLLNKIEELGSLRKAASCMGMSYQAAWKKLRATEEALGVKLVNRAHCKNDGMTLTSEAIMLRDSFKKWFDAVENCALMQAENLFPWHLRSFAKPFSIIR